MGTFELSSEKIQSRIDTLYDTEWYQPNACYPVVLGYFSSTSDKSLYTVGNFLRAHNEKKGFLNMEDYKKKLLALCENFNDGLASDQVLAQFSKLTGLKSFPVPLSKNNGVLEATKGDFKGETVVLEFLCDRELRVLDYLHTWRSKWFKYDNTVRSFKGSHHGGEGFLSIANCNVDLEGTVTAVSFASIFGLIPISIDLPSTIGPGTSDSSLQPIKATCTYSNAILVYPKENALGYFYYS